MVAPDDCDIVLLLRLKPDDDSIPNERYKLGVLFFHVGWVETSIKVGRAVGLHPSPFKPMTTHAGPSGPATSRRLLQVSLNSEVRQGSKTGKRADIGEKDDSLADRPDHVPSHLEEPTTAADAVKSRPMAHPQPYMRVVREPGGLADTVVHRPAAALMHRRAFLYPPPVLGVFRSDSDPTIDRKLIDPNLDKIPMQVS